MRIFGVILLLGVAAFATLAQDGARPLVETVDIQGNRRLRDEDLLYYIKTRPGDSYSPAQAENDLRELLALNFFDKIGTRVLTERGVRGGVNVIFEVTELPIVRSLEFRGNKSIQESDILKAFREKRVGVAKEAVFNPVNAQKAIRVIRELLAGRGYPNATVNFTNEEVSATSTAVVFDIVEGRRSRIVDIEFEGMEKFTSGELRGQLQFVRETGLISRVKGFDVLDLRKLEYDLQKNVREYMFSKGYFQAQIGEPRIVGLGVKRTGFVPYVTLPLPLVTTKDDTLRIVIPVTEGRVYRVGEVKIEGNSIFSEQQIGAGLGLQKGAVVDARRLRNSLFEELKKAYGAQGFVLYDAELSPDFHDNPANPKEGVVDLTITIDEGKQFRLRRLEFIGNTFTRDKVLRREFLLNEGDTYNQQTLEYSVSRLNQTGFFDPINKDEDVEVRTDEELGDVDLVVKVKEKGRQQVSVNGGIGGNNGTSFGLEYSTNNLFGRGEVTSLQLGVGSRSNSFQLTYQNPYFRDRPISVGFSVFGSSYKFYGAGTYYSDNAEAYTDYLNYSGTTTAATDSNNLFTQTTYGASVFATTQLSEIFFKKRRFSQFSRIGLTYQLAATRTKEPAVNSSGDASKYIPNVFATPGYISSRVTASYVYDTREPSANGIDTARGSQLSLGFALTGLGGDVRTYQPTLSYTSFIPVYKTRSKNAHVFAFRIIAGTIGAYNMKAKVRDSNSFSFINGTPYAERYFLGSENDLRGYQNRAIGPVAPIDQYVTSRNVVAASNSSETAVPLTGLTDAEMAELAALGTYTGIGGANPAKLSSSFQATGGDTQLLGNFEYRIPVFGPVSLAAFADVGAVYNVRKSSTQTVDSAFLADDRYLGASVLTALAAQNNPNLGLATGSLLLSGNRLLTNAQYYDLFCRGNRSGCPLSLPPSLQSIYLRGEAQTNSYLYTSQSLFAKLKDFKSSVGLELRVQVPVVNVPFRLYYYYNPRGKFGYTDELPNVYLAGQKSGFRFTVGRTF